MQNSHVLSSRENGATLLSDQLGARWLEHHQFERYATLAASVLVMWITDTCRTPRDVALKFKPGFTLLPGHTPEDGEDFRTRAGKILLSDKLDCSLRTVAALADLWIEARAVTIDFPNVTFRVSEVVTDGTRRRDLSFDVKPDSDEDLLVAALCLALKYAAGSGGLRRVSFYSDAKLTDGVMSKALSLLNRALETGVVSGECGWFGLVLRDGIELVNRTTVAAFSGWRVRSGASSFVQKLGLRMEGVLRDELGAKLMPAMVEDAMTRREGYPWIGNSKEDNPNRDCTVRYDLASIRYQDIAPVRLYSIYAQLSTIGEIAEDAKAYFEYQTDRAECDLRILCEVRRAFCAVEPVLRAILWP